LDCGETQLKRIRIGAAVCLSENYSDVGYYFLGNAGNVFGCMPEETLAGNAQNIAMFFIHSEVTLF
jgi:hypothetical protein